MGYESDRQWSDQFIPEIKRIVGPYLLQTAPDYIDHRQAGDLIILHARDKRIACRIRRPGYAERYPYQFTIRYHRDSGVETEYEKIMKGWADWMFYGHATAGNKISRWLIVDLDVFRYHHINNAQVVSGIKPNGDGTFFKWYDAISFPKSSPILIASSDLEKRDNDLKDAIDEFEILYKV